MPLLLPWPDLELTHSVGFASAVERRVGGESPAPSSPLSVERPVTKVERDGEEAALLVDLSRRRFTPSANRFLVSFALKSSVLLLYNASLL